MWCVVDAEDVPRTKLKHDAVWGWVHEAEAGWHTVGGTPVEPNGEGEPGVRPTRVAGLPAVAAVQLNVKVT